VVTVLNNVSVDVFMRILSRRGARARMTWEASITKPIAWARVLGVGAGRLEDS
jgi:hypothetical protein